MYRGDEIRILDETTNTPNIKYVNFLLFLQNFDIIHSDDEFDQLPEILSPRPGTSAAGVTPSVPPGPGAPSRSMAFALNDDFDLSFHDDVMNEDDDVGDESAGV